MMATNPDKYYSHLEYDYCWDSEQRDQYFAPPQKC